MKGEERFLTSLKYLSMIVFFASLLSVTISDCLDRKHLAHFPLVCLLKVFMSPFTCNPVQHNNKGL